ncbi:hypothetical protein [Agrobacterium tumefaciens]|uniref:hypothetical protein n=1 Tax=Agrobacterium tumefaciens TaxID=358 RepID=UPI00045966FA|nr:hypothetical protein [Agrobacterium tumefaciens]CDN92530.1 hypothetical protein BN949_01675 [Agrobacterium tumefaciens]
MKYITLFVAAALFSSISVTQAQARKARLFAVPGFGGGESIDLVYDLPNTATFLREGKAFDLGYLNSDNGSGYVLYNGDRYSKLSDADIAKLKVTLGFDPTTKHRMEQAARDEENTRWGFVIFIAVLVAGFFVFVHKGLHFIRWFARALTTPAVTGNGSADAAPDPLEVRTKQLVNRQWSGSQTDYAARVPASSSMHASPRADAPVKTFGRRSA